MLGYILKRLLVAFCVCATVSAISFALMFLSGDPAIAIAGGGGRAQDAEAVRIAYGFDRPIVIQYLDWIGSALRGDLGRSIYFNVPVTEIIQNRVGVTLRLGVFSFLLALILAVTGQAIPSFWLGLMAIVVFGVWYGCLRAISAAGLTLITVLGLLLSDRFAVVTRAAAQSLRHQEFIMGLRAIGASRIRILFLEILPNMQNTILVIVTLEVTNVILLEAALSCLGLGVRPPTPSWGLMNSEGRDNILLDPWLIALPGSALCLLVLAVNMFGDGMRDVTGPVRK